MSDTATVPKRRESRRPFELVPKLRLLYTPESGLLSGSRLHSLSLGETSIGRDLGRGNGIAVQGDRGMSRIHARLVVEDDGLAVSICDQHSTNGTFVNRERITTTTRLSDGDIIQTGDSFWLLRYEPLFLKDELIPSIIGISAPMKACRVQVARYAKADCPLLILGETGTGKEVVANAIHQLSKRTGPLKPVNCAAVPETLAESEFFGHVAHSFTGAKNSIGHYLAADRGTLFLDEIGDMKSSLQPLLLRALEEGRITPIGTTKSVAADVRIVAATNRSLTQDVEAGRFRPDLLARLSGIEIHLPRLRERREDILLLLHHFLASRTVDLSCELIEALLTYDWPFNVRELSKAAERLVLDGPESVISEYENSIQGKSPKTTTHEAVGQKSAPRSRRTDPASAEIIAALTECDGVVIQAAERLRIPRPRLYQLMDRLGIDKNLFRPSNRELPQ